MIPVCRARTVRARDHAVIEGVGIPGRVLMELAGRRAAEVVRDGSPGASVAVLCGPGNNGGDGFVVARWLQLWGHRVRTWCPRPPTTPDARANRQLLTGTPAAPVGIADALDGADVVVDALLGTGQKSAPRGAVEEGVVAIRAARDRGARVVALDLPTGVCADTGAALGGDHLTVNAHDTVTFGYWKPGLLCAPGAALAGAVHVVDIGLDLAIAHNPTGPATDAWLLTADDIRPLLSPPPTHGAKWDRGHVAVRAGGGAAVLASLGAFAAGAGLVTLLAPRNEWSAFHGLDPSVILAEPDTLDARRHDALVIGPGLGTQRTHDVVHAWRSAPMPVLADADALTILAHHPTSPEVDHPRVITPHAAEAGRLLGMRRAKVDADRFAAVQALNKLGTPVLKGPFTLVGGDTPRVAPFADGRLAVAGSGDVLSGCIGAALASGASPVDAASLGVWLHGAAAEHMPTYGTARHLVDAIRTAAGALMTPR